MTQRQGEDHEPVREGSERVPARLWRIQPEKARAEEGGRRIVPATVGDTFVPLLICGRLVVFAISDTANARFIDDIPPGADPIPLILDGDGMIPLGVQRSINLMLDVEAIVVRLEKERTAHLNTLLQEINALKLKLEKVRSAQVVTEMPKADTSWKKFLASLLAPFRR